MKKRRGFENYDYLSTDVIKLACSGDKEALGKVIARYDNYAIKCTKSMAVSKFGLDVETIPIDDIMQTANSGETAQPFRMNGAPISVLTA